MIDATIGRFWSCILRILMQLTGCRHTLIAMGTLFLAQSINMWFALVEPISALMCLGGWIWLFPVMLRIHKNTKAISDTVPVPPLTIQRIVVIRLLTVGIFCGRALLLFAVHGDASYKLFYALGPLLYTASCYFVLDFQPPRKSWGRRAIDWGKGRNLSLGGGHVPAPTPI